VQADSSRACCCAGQGETGERGHDEGLWRFGFLGFVEVAVELGFGDGFGDAGFGDGFELVWHGTSDVAMLPDMNEAEEAKEVKEQQGSKLRRPPLLPGSVEHIT